MRMNEISGKFIWKIEMNPVAKRLIGWNVQGNEGERTVITMQIPLDTEG
ncbi:hypothetical protein [Neobacillus mesonae]|nr:hypothetical protein [Neobacillus mesonae]